MTIQVTIKTVYGERRIYPICPKAKLFANFTSGKTLTDNAINIIKQLGYKIEVVQDVLEL